jgi:queuine tRNA-ribosyltransferase
VGVVGLGIDMCDCVIPTRCARNGLAFTSLGRVKMRNLTHYKDERPLDPACDCPACTRFSRAYLRHLLVSGEVLGLTLMSLHNIRYYVRLMERMRQAIVENRFSQFRDQLAKESNVE